ncbi:hypothetical protein [Aquimarina sp. MAR_2010_214]|uniref:hypothetical protein n=1 Tax=Aquimarina sp. MAR_2010_214 TaxID=1250026 RepID=UPI0011775A50|nr:hypothetical protein [Aquimarina sp. MAR_2010_214]
MKILFKLLILGMVYLVSNTTYAQIVQYSDDGTKSCIDCEEKNSETVESCYCFGIVQLGYFDLYIPKQDNTLKEQWLKNQEKLLSKEMGGHAQQNFNDVQMNYFRNKETNKAAESYYTNLEQNYRAASNFDQSILNKTTTVTSVLEYRNANGGSVNLDYGDLMYEGNLIRNMNGSAISNAIYKEGQKRDRQRTTYKNLRKKLYKLELANDDGYIQKFLANQYIKHYNNLDYEQAVRFMTRYMVAINENHYPYVYQSFGLANNVFSIKDHVNEYMPTLTTNFESTPNTAPDPVWEALSRDESLFRYAINANSAFIFEEKDKQFIATHPKFRKQLKQHFETNTYSHDAMVYPNTVLTQFLENNTSTVYEEFEQLVIPNAAFSFFDTGNNRMMVHGFKLKDKVEWLDGNYYYNYKGFSNILAELFKHNSTAQQYALEGSFIKAYLKGGNFSIAASVSDEDLGRFFDFGYVQYNTANESIIPLTLAHPFSGVRGFAIEAMNAFLGGGKVYFDDEVIFDSSFVSSKGKCVYDYIKQTNGSLFRNTIRNFIDNKEYDLKMVVEPFPSSDNADARTDDEFLDSKGFITIRFNSRMVNTHNPIQWAANILHEGIHAEIFRFVHKNDPNVKPRERARVVQLYLHYKDSDWNDEAQHIHMTEKYVTPIAKALRELDKNQYSLDHYMHFAWEGLIEHAPEYIKPTPQQLSEWANLSNKVLENNNIPCQ